MSWFAGGTTRRGGSAERLLRSGGKLYIIEQQYEMTDVGNLNQTHTSQRFFNTELSF